MLKGSLFLSFETQTFRFDNSINFVSVIYSMHQLQYKGSHWSTWSTHKLVNNRLHSTSGHLAGPQPQEYLTICVHLIPIQPPWQVSMVMHGMHGSFLWCGKAAWDVWLNASDVRCGPTHPRDLMTTPASWNKKYVKMHVGCPAMEYI